MRCAPAGIVTPPEFAGGQPDGSPAVSAEPPQLPLRVAPPWARAGEPVHWWCRATVSADGAVSFWDDDGSAWLAENGL